MFEFFSKKICEGGTLSFFPVFSAVIFLKKGPPSLFFGNFVPKNSKYPLFVFLIFFQRYTSYFICIYGFLGRKTRRWQSFCTKYICHSYILVRKCVPSQCCPKKLKNIMKNLWNKKWMLMILKLQVSRNNTTLSEYVK